MIDVTTQGVSTSNADNGPALAAIFARIVNTREPCLLPPGQLNVATPFPVLQNGQVLDVRGQNTLIKYTGSSPATLLPLVNVRHVFMDGVTFDGGKVSATIIDQSSTPTSGGYTPTQWRFSRGGFQNSALLYHVGGSTNCDGTLFDQWGFLASLGGIGFRSDNANSLCNTFKHCDLSGGAYSIYINGGSFVTEGSQFSGNDTADIHIGAHSPCAIRGGWSQGSYRFVEIPFATTPCNVSVEDISLSSFPANWAANGGAYKPGELVQPFAQRGAIYCNRRQGLSIRNSLLIDPVANLPVYAVSARPASEPIAWSRDQSFTTNGGPSAFEAQIWNQNGVIT